MTHFLAETIGNKRLAAMKFESILDCLVSILPLRK